MKSFNDISIGVLVMLLVFLIIELAYFSKHDDHLDLISKMDSNGDGIISQEELANFIREETAKRRHKEKKLPNILKSASSGAIRGCIMGFLINGMEGALTGAVVFAITNPIITGIEHAM